MRTGKLSETLKKIVIVGVGDFAELCSHYIREYFTDWEICAYSVDSQYRTLDSIKGIPVVNFETLRENYTPQEYEVFVAIGYKKMNNIRAEKFSICKEWGYKSPNLIHPTAVVEKNVSMGEGNIVLENAVLAPGSILGNSNIIWNATNVSHEANIGNFNYFSVGTILGGKSNIGSNCFFGLNSTVRGGLRIEDYTLVGAGAYINNETKAYSVHVPVRSVCLPNKNSLDFFS